MQPDNYVTAGDFPISHMLHINAYGVFFFLCTIDI